MKVNYTCICDLQQALLEYIRDEQIPHEVADLFKIGRTKFYDGMLIRGISTNV